MAVALRHSAFKRWKQRMQPLWLPIAMGLLLLYTANQLLNGERGIVTWRVMKTQIASLEDENAQLQHNIDSLTRRINLLKGKGSGEKLGKPDADFLDELARSELGLVEPGDEVILVNGGVSPSSMRGNVLEVNPLGH